MGQIRTSARSFSSARTKPERHFEAEHLGFLRLAGLNRSEDGPARRLPFFAAMRWSADESGISATLA
jgi:hypothetical protein